MVPCRFPHSTPAVAVFTLSTGCFCYPDDREQALCLHHAMRATPAGSIDLIRFTSHATEFDQSVLSRRYLEGG